ncbi:MAG: histidine phosphatase family protein [Pseudomonadota bacterium]
MRDYPKIWFLRHGQTEWNKAYRLQGQLDSPLTEQGLDDAKQQALLMPPILALGPAIYVSPLGRARQTADIALDGADYVTDDRLMEVHAGDWQGQTREQVFAANPALAASRANALEIYAAAPNGEGMQAFCARVAGFLDGLTVPSVIVAHGLLGQVLRGIVRGMDMEEVGRLSNRQGCVYVLENGVETVLEAPE